MWYIVYNFVLMKNDTIVSVIICYDFYHYDFDMFYVLWWQSLIFNVRVWFMLILIT